MFCRNIGYGLPCLYVEGQLMGSFKDYILGQAPLILDFGRNETFGCKRPPIIMSPFSRFLDLLPAQARTAGESRLNIQ